MASRMAALGVSFVMAWISGCASDGQDGSEPESIVLPSEGTLEELPGDPLPFASAIFRATHNSYSGNLEGQKGPVVGQLDRGVRFLEYDIHDNGYATLHDYGIGHDAPGDAVDHADGNPASNALRDWLLPVASWSASHPQHAPLLVMLDLKDDLTDNASFAAGNLAALNAEIHSTLGSRLVLAKDVPGPLPTIGSLRGRILTLLSGHAGTRAAYRRDTGRNPAVAINGRGQVVEVHESGGSLWYWTGTYDAAGRVEWRRHGRYDAGKTPAVTLNDDGWLVEVHQSQTTSTLWYHVGRLGSDGEIAWSSSRRYDTGVLPTVRFADAAGTMVREIHRSPTNNQNWDWSGSLDTSTNSVLWDTATHGKTSDPRYDVAVSVRGSARVSVWTGADGASPADTLRYGTDRVAADRIRYPQWAFVEYQPNDPAELREGAWFYASPATNASFITAARRDGRIARGWDFDDPSRVTDPLANYPATNTPWADWYVSLMNQVGAVQ